MRQWSCRIVCWRRSTKPLVKACRGFVRVWRMPRPRQAQGEDALELAAAVGEDALDAEARASELRHDVLAQEASGDRGVGIADEERGEAVGGGGIAGGDLPDLADALEVADVEAVEADELAGLLGLDVPLRRQRTGLRDRPARALGEQAGALGAVALEGDEALLAARRARGGAARGRPCCARRAMPWRASWAESCCGPQLGQASDSARTWRSVVASSCGGRPGRPCGAWDAGRRARSARSAGAAGSTASARARPRGRRRSRCRAPRHGGTAAGGRRVRCPRGSSRAPLCSRVETRT